MSRSTYLDTLELGNASSGWCQISANQSIGGNPLHIQGENFDHGIGVHGNSSVRLQLNGTATKLQADIGIDTAVGEDYAAVIFKAYGDGRLLWESDTFRRSDSAIPVEIDLTGVNVLVLTTTDPADSNHAIWANARIEHEGDSPKWLEDYFLLETAETTMAFKIGGNHLYSHYLGPRLSNAADIHPQWNYAYPAHLNQPLTESAISLIQADGKVSLDLHYREHKLVKEGNAAHLTILLEDPSYPVSVELHYLAHAAENVIESWATVSNHGEQPITLNHAASGFLNLKHSRYHLTRFTGVWGAEAIMSENLLGQGVTELRSLSGTRTAQTAQPAFILSKDLPASEEYGEVIMGALAWSGNWRIRIEQTATKQVYIQSGYAPTLSRYQLNAGESLETPRFIFTHSTKGKGHASRSFHRWARNSGIRGGHEPRRILLNSWEGAYFKFDDKLIKNMITDAARAGIELFVLDDGWFGSKHPRDNDRAGLGDWMINTSKLKDGIQGLIDHSHQEGIDFGIWVEPEMVNPKSELYETHPDWTIELPHRDQHLMRTQLVLDLSNPAVQDYIFSFMDELLGKHPGISFVKWDCNRSISQPGSNYLPADQQERLIVDYVQGYYAVLEKITNKYPDVTFQACGSGGGRTDFGAMRYHHEFWTSDVTDALERIKMQWSINHLYPAIATANHVTEVPSHQTKRSTPIKFRFDVAMTGRLGFELRPERVPEADMAFSMKALEVYKSIRSTVQLGDLYRLSSPYESHVAALMYVNEEEGRAVFFAFTTGISLLSPFDTLPLQGLDPAKRYRITELNPAKEGKFISGYHGKELGGDALLQQGLGLHWGKGDYQSLVLQLETVEHSN
ncbi:alpha-galactosidase [Rubritalea squalenifaciens DSM 18772]|uniref:alpha-galactosidase n=1 Tax=Rubritalea squalenifaciens DSM 18772 TaxID=1123071 RepID=A0A1M6QGB9_9BACT|nr:alpha-galactosidase [Rubritalea squalenifaciens]SHK19215.1 alpha-galactosidase [Rubritalea squalenifaciens DSM 18772]